MLVSPLWYRLTRVSPGKRAVKRECVCVCVCVCVAKTRLLVNYFFSVFQASRIIRNFVGGYRLHLCYRPTYS